MHIAAVMDPLSRINYQKDTSYFLLRAALELNFKAYHIDQNDVFLWHNRAYAKVSELQLTTEKLPKLKVIQQSTVDLATMRLIFVRTDPPFDRRYFYTSLILEHLPQTTKVVNSPLSLRDWNEKLAALEFPEFTPPTLVTSTWGPVSQFAQKYEGRLVLKPMDGNGGKGIEFAHSDQKDLKEIIQRKTQNFSHRLVVQAYQPEAKDGDIRVLFCGDRILGSILRVHAPGEELNNLDRGATAHRHSLSSKQRKICMDVAPRLVAKGAHFVGIDFLGDWLIEINVTSPTGLQELCRFENHAYHHEVIKDLV